MRGASAASICRVNSSIVIIMCIAVSANARFWQINRCRGGTETAKSAYIIAAHELLWRLARSL